VVVRRMPGGETLAGSSGSTLSLDGSVRSSEVAQARGPALTLGLRKVLTLGAAMAAGGIVVAGLGIGRRVPAAPVANARITSAGVVAEPSAPHVELHLPAPEGPAAAAPTADTAGRESPRSDAAPQLSPSRRRVRPALVDAAKAHTPSADDVLAHH